MSQQICALKRLITKEEHNKFKEIILKNINEVYTIGRDTACNRRITSIEISRKHAVIEFIDNNWFITDLASTNGLFINSVQLQSHTPHCLTNGDRVSFGPPNQSEFNYQFIDNYLPNNTNNSLSYELSAINSINLTTIPVIPIVTRIQTDSTEQLLPSNTLRFNIEPNVSRTISITADMPTRSGTNYQISTVSSTRSPRMSVSTSNSGVNTSSSQYKRLSSRSKNTSNNTNNSRSHALNNFIEHDYSRSSSAIVANDEPVIGSKSAHKNRISSKNKSSQLKLKELPSGKSKDSKIGELEKKRIAKEMEKLEKARKDLEEKKESERLRIKQKEDSLKAKMKELEKKEKEARKREEQIDKLQKQLNQEKKKLEEKYKLNNNECEESRKSSKRKLVERSDSNHKPIDSKRLCNNQNSDKEKEKQIEEIFESEMTCSVCSEYFIHAVNLKCSHTFCFACIEEWKSNGKHGCPICRKDIENQNRELVLDNLIDQFVTKMKPQLLERRKALIEERKKKLEKITNQSDSTSSRRLNGSRGSIPNIFPRLHFFLRETIDGSDSDSDPDSDDVNVIGFGYADDYVSSSSSSSSQESSDSDQQSSDSSNYENTSDEESDAQQTSLDIDSDSSLDSSLHSNESEDEDFEDSYSSPYVSFSSTNRNDSESDLESTYGAESDHSYQSDDSIDLNDSDSHFSSDY